MFHLNSLSYLNVKYFIDVFIDDDDDDQDDDDDEQVFLGESVILTPPCAPAIHCLINYLYKNLHHDEHAYQFVCQYKRTFNSQINSVEIKLNCDLFNSGHFKCV